MVRADFPLLVKLKEASTGVPAVTVPKETVLSSKMHWAAFLRCSALQESKLPRVRALISSLLDAFFPLTTGVA